MNIVDSALSPWKPIGALILVQVLAAPAAARASDGGKGTWRDRAFAFGRLLGDAGSHDSNLEGKIGEWHMLESPSIGPMGDLTTGEMAVLAETVVPTGLVFLTKLGYPVGDELRVFTLDVHPEALAGGGIRSLDVWTSDAAALSVGLRLGTRSCYTLMAVGVDPSRSGTRLLAGVGGGFQLGLPAGFSLAVDLVPYAVLDDRGGRLGGVDELLLVARTTIGYPASEHFSLFAGVAASLHVALGGGHRPRTGEAAMAGRGLPVPVSPGFVLGLRIM